MFVEKVVVVRRQMGVCEHGGGPVEKMLARPTVVIIGYTKRHRKAIGKWIKGVLLCLECAKLTEARFVEAREWAAKAELTAKKKKAQAG